MKHLVVLLLALLLIQPMLDSFDVADYNGAIKQASTLLIQQSELDAHCIKSDDHNTHQADHLQLANALADALEDSHCHVCHVSALFSHIWHYSVSAIENESISLADIRFKSRLIVPDLRPPIPSLIS
ncbi:MULTISPECIES: hypothetical protein [unclassified Pseudoalteromonas]|uniref:hypothetical protein n=1 Tax=unclassified Pseudoalteromonas TaxID=194690 RepID=UPI0025B2EB38|nr:MULTISPECIES: hypothetical protein [unclassified Pseudoalteromonas]MDN3379823.1 hypothetical protein [Pseudoalteromonas sp. APC 3893]MDN3388163.1 hypothetical protein [Pseudoalteromonas sp. APC 4017]